MYNIIWEIALMKKKELQEKVGALQKENLSLKRRLERARIQDGLTGLYKKAFFEELLEKEVYRAKRYEGIFSVVMVKLKSLKEEGQMKRAASLLKKSLSRDIDVVARFSRRCFALLLPETSHPRALVVGRRIKKKIKGVLGRGVEVNVGVATYPYAAGSKDELIRRAKRNLSKSQARDKSSCDVLEEV